MSGKVKRFRDKKDQFRWNVTARNGNILADSGEGYTRLRGAENGAVATAVAIFQDPVLGPRVRAKLGLPP